MSRQRERERERENCCCELCNVYHLPNLPTVLRTGGAARIPFDSPKTRIRLAWKRILKEQLRDSLSCFSLAQRWRSTLIAHKRHRSPAWSKLDSRTAPAIASSRLTFKLNPPFSMESVWTLHSAKVERPTLLSWSQVFSVLGAALSVDWIPQAMAAMTMFLPASRCHMPWTENQTWANSKDCCRASSSVMIPVSGIVLSRKMEDYTDNADLLKSKLQNQVRPGLLARNAARLHLAAYRWAEAEQRTFGIGVKVLERTTNKRFIPLFYQNAKNLIQVW